MIKIPLVDLTQQHLSLKREISTAINNIISSSSFINGHDNELFEEEFAHYCQAKYCIGVGSGSAALDLALESLGIADGDGVICPSHTFTATAEAIVHRRAKPIFIDIQESSYNLDPDLLEAKITRRTKAIIAVHLYGNPVDLDPVQIVCRKHKLAVIEDCAQAHGATYKGKKVGSLGDVACFSFFPAKNLGCFGDGGAVVTNSKQIADQVRLLKDHGRKGKYDHLKIGYGYRLDNIQAAILRVKLRYLDKWNSRRREIAEIYNQTLSSHYITPVPTPHSQPVYYVYTLRHHNREKITTALNHKGISTGIYYPIPLHQQKCYQGFGSQKNRLPITEKICREIFSIPMHPHLLPKQVNFISSTLLNLIY